MARKNVTTSIETDLIKQLKYLAVDRGKPLNELFEEAIQDLLGKYGRSQVYAQTYATKGKNRKNRK